MGKPLKIIDVAKKMIELRGLKVFDNISGSGDIAIKIIGLKPGEKLYEEQLLTETQRFQIIQISFMVKIVTSISKLKILLMSYKL